MWRKEKIRCCVKIYTAVQGCVPKMIAIDYFLYRAGYLVYKCEYRYQLSAFILYLISNFMFRRLFLVVN